MNSTIKVLVIIIYDSSHLAVKERIPRQKNSRGLAKKFNQKNCSILVKRIVRFLRPTIHQVQFSLFRKNGDLVLKVRAASIEISETRLHNKVDGIKYLI